MRTLAIIPAYNEEEALVSTIDALRAAVPEVDFLIVNDGSKDNTAEICRIHEYPFLDLPINLGLSGAFQAGMKYADWHGYDCAIQYDADGQHLPGYIHALEDSLADHDIAIGSRFINSKQPASLRGFGGRLIAGAIRFTTGQRITDPTSGMRAFNRRMIHIMACNENMGPEPDTISHLIKHANASVVEVPVEMAERQGGESYLNLWTSGAYMLRMTVSILLIQFFRKNPMEQKSS